MTLLKSCIVCTIKINNLSNCFWVYPFIKVSLRHCCTILRGIIVQGLTTLVAIFIPFASSFIDSANRKISDLVYPYATMPLLLLISYPGREPIKKYGHYPVASFVQTQVLLHYRLFQNLACTVLQYLPF